MAIQRQTGKGKPAIWRWHARFRICSTASATARRESPSPLFWNSSASALLSSVIGSSVAARGSRNSTLTHLPSDHLSLAHAGLQVPGHSARRACRRNQGTINLGAPYPRDAPLRAISFFEKLRARCTGDR
jgi:hypothetical protein